MPETTTPKKPWYKRKRYILPLLLLALILVIPKGDNAPAPASNNTGNGQTVTTPAPKQPEYDAQAAYDKVQAGQTRAEAVALIGIPASSCSESTVAGYGTTAYCSYTKGFSRSSLSVVYHEGTVQSKNLTKL